MQYHYMMPCWPSQVGIPPHFMQAPVINQPMRMLDYGPRPYVVDLEQAARQNQAFRSALWTGKHLQLTLMSLNTGEDVGVEVHKNTDQYLRIEEGCGRVQIGMVAGKVEIDQYVTKNMAIFVPAGAWHNLLNVGNTPLKLTSVYAPPEHPYGTVHPTKPNSTY